MRPWIATIPALLMVAAAFSACGGTSTNSGDGGSGNDASTDVSEDPFLEAPGDDASDASGPHCTFIQPAGAADPVDLCVLLPVLQNQQEYGFTSKGTHSSWNYKTLIADPPTGTKIHDFHDDASYGASCAAYHHWAVLYANPQPFDVDIEALAPILEAELKTLPQEYDGELYFNLRRVADGLTAVDFLPDQAKIDAIADSYARQIYADYYFDLPTGPTGDAGIMDSGSPDGGVADAGFLDATSGADAEGDPHYEGDGIIGVNQLPTTGMPGILYQPASVASAAYALIDMALRHPADADAYSWIAAARRSLDHIHNHAREPVSGLYYVSMVTTGAPSDILGPLSTPADLLSTDVQATTVLYLLRAQQRVVQASGEADGGMSESDAEVSDASDNPLAIMENFPFVERTAALLSAVQVLWDGGEFLPDGGIGPVPTGDTALGGFMDGYVPSTMELVKTKSTRPNAYLFADLHLQVVAATGPFGSAPPPPSQLNETIALQILLSNEVSGSETPENMPNTNLLSVVTDQAAYFDTVTQKFELLSDEAGATVTYPESYTAAAIAAVIQGFDTQLAGFSP
jgi:hypothetical protein